MSEWWAISMLISGGLFAGGALSIACERAPVWRAGDPSDFLTSFAHTLRRMDRLQPTLLAMCLVSTIGFAITAAGAARTSALFAAAGFLIVLVGSGVWLVPLQRRLVGYEGRPPSPYVEQLRTRWLRGHLIRTIVSVAALTLAVLAAVS